MHGIRLSGEAICTGNTVINCSQVGIAGSENSVVIRQNYIFSNKLIGISGTGVIDSNTIISNKVGIQPGPSVTPTIENNNIYSNTENNLVINGQTNIDASNNYWGTTDSTAIEQKIHDSKDDFSLGTATYRPFLSQPNPDAPSKPLVLDTSNPVGVVQSNSPDNSSDWFSLIGDPRAQSPLEISILQVTEIAIITLAIGWAVVFGFFAHKHFKNKRIQQV